MRNIILALATLICLMSCDEINSDRILLGEDYANEELIKSLEDTSVHNFVTGQTALIKDSLTAVAIAEPVLSAIYGKENILKQRPYEVYHLEHYWVLMGTLPKGSEGGTFLIIMDDKDSRIIRITHGK